MKLLVLTQKVDKNDSDFGFFHDWLTELSKNCQKISVVALKVGEYDLPANIKVYSLGKENGESRVKYLKNFFKYIFSLRKDYDSVFVHMNHEYVLLGGIFWRIWHKKIGLWYVHRKKSFGLWLSEKLVNIIFTSAPESFRIKSKKVNYVGHGLDSSKFVCNQERSNNLKIIHVGRITPIKNIETLILATDILRQKQPDLSVKFIGSPTSKEDFDYLENIKKIIKEKSLENIISFVGSIPNKDLAGEFCSGTLSVNMTPTGGWDKVVIESLMAKCPVFASNESLKPLFGTHSHLFLFSLKNHDELASKISSFLINPNKADIIESLSASVRAKYDYKILMNTLASKLK